MWTPESETKSSWGKESGSVVIITTSTPVGILLTITKDSSIASGGTSFSPDSKTKTSYTPDVSTETTYGLRSNVLYNESGRTYNAVEQTGLKKLYNSLAPNNTTTIWQ